MKRADLTLNSPEENLACDEALLDLCEEGREGELLRFWESDQYFVVLGHSSRAKDDVVLDVCAARQIPVLRRYSGGGTVLQGPGCLNFSLFLKMGSVGPFSTITGTNTFILGLHAQALQPFVREGIHIEGSLDLAVNGRKFSGNAQRRRQRFLLFHGTFLHAFDIPVIDALLRAPSKQPAYRRNRSHGDFLANIRVDPRLIKNALTGAWDAGAHLTEFPADGIAQLVRTRYTRPDWNFKY